MLRQRKQMKYCINTSGAQVGALWGAPCWLRRCVAHGVLCRCPLPAPGDHFGAVLGRPAMLREPARFWGSLLVLTGTLGWGCWGTRCCPPDGIEQWQQFCISRLPPLVPGTHGWPSPAVSSPRLAWRGIFFFLLWTLSVPKSCIKHLQKPLTPHVFFMSPILS